MRLSSNLPPGVSEFDEHINPGATGLPGRPRGRGKPSKEKSDQWTVYVPRSLAMKIDMLFFNPASGRIRYGYRTALVNKLLRQWLAAQVVETLDQISEEGEDDGDE